MRMPRKAPFTDDSENVWVTGEQNNEVFLGASGQFTFNGGFVSQSDVYVAKFDAMCKLEYFTAWGGSGFDRGWSITHDEVGSVFVVGYTDSDDIDNYADQISLNDNSLNGLSDGFLLKLNFFGNIIVDSYLGGDGLDVCTGVAYQWNPNTNQRDLWICGHGNNGANFPTLTYGSWNQTHAGGFDGFIMRLVGSSHQQQWCSWFGSNENDFISDIAIVTSDPVFIGVTEAIGYSDDECVIPGDGLFPNCNNNNVSWQWPWFDYSGTNLSNYFIGRFNDQNLTLRWSTFLGAAPSFVLNNNKSGIATKSTGFTEESSGLIFVTGTAPILGSNNFPIVDSGINGYNQNSFGGGSQDMFLSRFRVVGNSALLTWSTFIGGMEDENGFGLAIDETEKVFLTGWVKSSNLQDELDWCDVPVDDTFPLCNENGLNYMETDEICGNSQRTVIMSFDQNTSIRWSTQFGDGPNNNGRAITVGGEKLFIAGHSEQAWTILEYDELSEEDYFQPSIGGSRDGVLARFDIPTIVSLEDLESSRNSEFIVVYPNPSVESLTIRLANELNDSGMLTVFDGVGKQVRTFQLRAGIKEFTFITSELPTGLYHLVLNSSNHQATCTFVKL
jgi:hypothetical protein